MEQEQQSWRIRWRHIIFGTDTTVGRRFDQLLLVAILTSVATVILESVASISELFGRELRLLEWFFTILFTIEYILRLWISARPADLASVPGNEAGHTDE